MNSDSKNRLKTKPKFRIKKNRRSDMSRRRGSNGNTSPSTERDVGYEYLQAMSTLTTKPRKVFHLRKMTVSSAVLK